MNWPLLFDPKRILLGRPPWRFDKSAGARIGVLPRYADGKQVRWFEGTHTALPGVALKAMWEFLNTHLGAEAPAASSPPSGG